LYIRGIISDADVQTLRRVFRSVVSEELPVDLSKVSSFGVEELYMCVVSKTVELQNLVTQKKSSASLLVPRFRTRLYQLRGRLLHLTNLRSFPSNITTSHYHLDRFEYSIANNAQRVPTAHPNPLPGKLGELLGRSTEETQET
jgi:hypothetical protein